MSDDNIFTGLKVVDLASFIARWRGACRFRRGGAKVEPPTGEALPSESARKSETGQLCLTWTPNKRGLALDLKARDASHASSAWSNGPTCSSLTRTPGAPKLGLETRRRGRFRGRYADLTGYGDNGPDAISGLRFHRILGPQRTVVADPRRQPQVSGSGDHATTIASPVSTAAERATAKDRT